MALLFMVMMCGALMYGQSLYELAQKEKARRAKLKGKTSRVITNADLKSPQSSVRTTARSSQPAAEKRPQTASPSSSPANPKVVPSRSGQEREEGRTTVPVQKQVQRDATATSDSQNQRGPSSSSLSYATEVIGSTRLVNRPELALKQPDGQYAEIKYSGILDLSLTAQNGPGDDIAIYARPSGGDDVGRGGQEEGGISTAAAYGMVEGFWYGVFAMDRQGEWIALGKGTGRNRPESFDLGSLASTSRIRIVFHPSPNADLPYNRFRNTPQEITFDIDAAAVLH